MYYIIMTVLLACAKRLCARGLTCVHALKASIQIEGISLICSHQRFTNILAAWVFTALLDLFSVRHDDLLNVASYITLDNLSLSKRRGRKELLPHDSLQRVEKMSRHPEVHRKLNSKGERYQCWILPIRFFVFLFFRHLD